MVNYPGGFTPAIIHVAVADMDATYGAYVAAENDTFKNTDYNSYYNQLFLYTNKLE